MSIEDSFNENDGLLNAMGHMAAISQRNQQIAQQKEHSEAIRKQTAELEKANRNEADRTQIEMRRLNIEEQRLKAEEADREMRRQAAEQVKQLRNLIADSFETLDRLSKNRHQKGEGASGNDAFLRSVAALQARLWLLESQSDTLTELADMKELRALRSALADFIAGEVAEGHLPENPLADVQERLIAVARFFSEAQSVLNKMLRWKSDWLNQIPEVTHDELVAAQVELTDLNAGLPVVRERLLQMISPTDWQGQEYSIDLQPELLMCAEALGIRLLPIDKNDEDHQYERYAARTGRLELYSFAWAKGRLADTVNNHLSVIEKRIEDLIQLHQDHVTAVEVTRSHLVCKNLKKAEHSLHRIAGRFSDIDYIAVENDLRQMRSLARACITLYDRIGKHPKKEELKKLKDEYARLKELTSVSDSELGRLADEWLKLAGERIPGCQANRTFTSKIYSFFLGNREDQNKERAIQQAKFKALMDFADIGVEICIPVSNDQTTIKMMWCPNGSFTMGSPATEYGREADSEEQTKVILSKGFWLAKTPITQSQWKSVMDSNPSDSSYREIGDLPVTNISWNDIEAFIKKVNTYCFLQDRWKMTLPTEAQWEYACRAGELGPFSGGTIDEVAWYADNSDVKTHPVGLKKPNAWGLHDMHGNVEEWCVDIYNFDQPPGGVDPVFVRSPHDESNLSQSDESDFDRVRRGGHFLWQAADCRAAARSFDMDHDSPFGGFRPALIWSDDHAKAEAQ